MISDDFGRDEHKARLADLAEVRAGTMTLEQAQSNAKQRRKAAGLSMGKAARLVGDAGKARRRAALAQGGSYE